MAKATDMAVSVKVDNEFAAARAREVAIDVALQLPRGVSSKGAEVELIRKAQVIATYLLSGDAPESS